MKLTYVQGIFVFECKYTDRQIPRDAGFIWYKPERRDLREYQLVGKKAWVTNRPSVAVRLRKYADDDAEHALAAYVAEVGEAVKASRAKNADINIPCPAGREFFPYQKAGIQYGLERDGVLIADEPGLGKTPQSIGIANVVATSPDDKILIVCPANLRINWKREVDNWYIHDPKVFVVEKNLPSKDDDWNVLVINYEKFSVKRRKEFTVFCKKQNFSFLICDEAHNLKSLNAARTKELLGARRGTGIEAGVPRKCFLTGTPILNKPIELWPILSRLRPDVFGNKLEFETRFCNRHWNGFAFDVSGSSNEEELQELLRSTVMVRRKKSEVLSELPPKTRQVLVLPADKLEKLVKKEKAAQKEAQPVIDDILNELDKANEVNLENRAEYAAVVQKLSRKISDFSDLAAARHRLAMKKVPYIIEHIESHVLPSAKKVVLFGYHQDVCEAYRQHFGDRCVKLVGGMSLAQQDEAVQKFQQDESIEVFIGSIGAAGVGHTLTASSFVIFAELDWVPEIVSQAEDRCIVSGQRIQTKKGLVPIERVEPGDFVLTARGRLSEVTDVRSRTHVGKTVRLYYKGYEQPLHCTDDHLILCKSAHETSPVWRRAAETEVGDYLCFPTRQDEFSYLPIVIKNVENHRLTDSFPKVYDLTTKEDQSFVVGHAAVHNCHRIGQLDNVMVQHMVVDGSLDAYMAHVLVEKQQLIDKSLNDETGVEKAIRQKNKQIIAFNKPLEESEVASSLLTFDDKPIFRPSKVRGFNDDPFTNCTNDREFTPEQAEALYKALEHLIYSRNLAYLRNFAKIMSAAEHEENKKLNLIYDVCERHKKWLPRAIHAVIFGDTDKAFVL